MTGHGMFDGAKITLGGIGNLGRALAEMTDDEVAYIVGRFMWENAATGIEPDARVFAASLGRAIQSVWSGEDVPKKVRDNVGYRLRQHGFSVVQRGPGIGGFAGWRVPNELVWDTDQLKRRQDPVPTVPASPVTTSYACPICGQRVANKHRLADHRSSAHGEFTATTYNVPLLEAMIASPGLPPREYARRMGRSPQGVTSMASKFIHAGLITVTGTRHSARYYPTAAAQPWLDAADPVKMNPSSPIGPRQLELIQAVREYPGLIATEYGQLMNVSGNGTSNSLHALAVHGLVHAIEGRWYPGKAKAGGSKGGGGSKPKPTPFATPPMPPPPVIQEAPVNTTVEPRPATLVGRVLMVDGKTYLIREWEEV